MTVNVVGFMCVFKQKTAYEMRISDWSSDVCASDLVISNPTLDPSTGLLLSMFLSIFEEDRTSVVSGKSVSVRVDLGGRCITKKYTQLIPAKYHSIRLIAHNQ